MKDVKIIIGANYGDEGKGLATRYFCLEGNRQWAHPIVVFSQGTAQRGHTIDYTESKRHVYHHFNSGTGDGIPTFFAKNFLIHPMEFVREYTELFKMGIQPVCYCDPEANVITPFDMLIDHMTEEYYSIINGKREFGSCGFGSWCATDRINLNLSNFKIRHFVFALKNKELFNNIIEQIWIECQEILVQRQIDIAKLPQYLDYFNFNSEKRKNLISHFRDDIEFFYKSITWMDFNGIWDSFGEIIFENGQGLGLDKDNGIEWHTTSKTGIWEPYHLLKDKGNFDAEVCYVTRSYLTRHGEGPISIVNKSEINSSMYDKTNVFNNFQGNFKYGYLDDIEQKKRIDADWAIVSNDYHYEKSLIITHTNEFDCGNSDSKYYSDNKFEIKERR